MDESESHCHDSKTKRHAGQKPSWSQPLAGHGAGDLEYNIGYVEDGENLVVLIPRQAQITFESGESSIAFANKRRQSGVRVELTRWNSPMFARSMKQNRYLPSWKVCCQRTPQREWPKESRRFRVSTYMIATVGIM